MAEEIKTITATDSKVVNSLGEKTYVIKVTRDKNLRHGGTQEVSSEVAFSKEELLRKKQKIIDQYDAELSEIDQLINAII